MNQRILHRSIFLLAWIISCCGLCQTVSADDVNFENDVQPILEAKCWHCHGPDEQEAGLRLDQRAIMLIGGDSGAATIVPGKPDKSYLIEVVKHLDEEMAMPPDDDKLSDEEIELLSQWIREGAKWPGQMDSIVEVKSDHWSFQPINRPAVPEVSFADVGPIDRFLLRTLKQNGLSMSKPAEARTLIRRVSIVLTGLAPKPEEVEAFVKASALNSDQAYTELVDRLIESPQFGERWAQHWLDVIRWAETNGSEANLYRKNAWIYRDYVVRAFNQDIPYDQFIREQIAGDSMGVGEATGFLVAGPHVPAATVGREPSAIRQARADRMDEIMQTVGASVLGVSIGCARCHNHKFDPISIQDYYSMTGVFQDIEFGSRFPEFANEHPRKQRGKALWKTIAANRTKLRTTGGWEEDWGAFRELHFTPTETQSIRIRFKTNNVTLDELEVFGPDQPQQNLALASQGTQLTGFPEKGFEGRNPIDRIIDGDYGTMTWRGKVEKGDQEKPWAVLKFVQPVTIERIRFSSNREYFNDTDYLDKKPYLPKYQYDIDVLDSDGNWKPYVNSWHVTNQLTKQNPERKEWLATIQAKIAQLSEEGPRPSFVGRLIPPATSYVLMRGSPENPRDEVMPAAPKILDGSLGLTSDDSGRKRRAKFAQWATSPDNPLTARVMANRIWHHIFGAGIVTTTSDFGTAGAGPTHPELLDWLAAELMEPSDAAAQPWSMKSMIRKLVMTKAFRQSSVPLAESMKIDADTALLWRFPPKRVEAEVIRDSILQASGSIDLSVGGRSYRIHNEKKTYAQWEVVDNHGPETWRRMIYQERMRRVDDQMFTAFDFPDCGQVRPKRPVSTTPLQALNLMNSKFVLEQSKMIADRSMKEANSNLPQAVERCFERLLGRKPNRDERDDCCELAKEFDLSLVCRALINSNEFAFLP
ncbi:MAG: PSD1 and planctomycete cytochrome C domain-containing protein [Planctomycetota bacterium]